jgi:hypothetical protein
MSDTLKAAPAAPWAGAHSVDHLFGNAGCPPQIAERLKGLDLDLSHSQRFINSVTALGQDGWKIAAALLDLLKVPQPVGPTGEPAAPAAE